MKNRYPCIFSSIICLHINRIFYELTLSLSYEYALVTAHNISILIRAAHCRWAEVCVFMLLYFLVTCTLVNNGCWQVDRACFFYQEKKFTKHTKCIYIDVWIDVWRLAYHIQLLLGWSTVVRLFRWTEKWSLQPPTRKNRKLHFSASISFYFLILIEILVLHLL